MRVVLAANFPTQKLGNKELRTKWIKNLTKEALARHADGVNIDIESPIPKRSREVTLLTKLVNETATAFRSVIKNAQVCYNNIFKIFLMRKLTCLNMWLALVFSTFQHVNFGRSVLTLFISGYYNSGIK